MRVVRQKIAGPSARLQHKGTSDFHREHGVRTPTFMAYEPRLHGIRTTAFVQRKTKWQQPKSKKRPKENKNKKSKPFCALVAACLSSSDLCRMNQVYWGWGGFQNVEVWPAGHAEQCGLQTQFKQDCTRVLPQLQMHTARDW